MKEFAALFLRVLTISAGCSAVLVPLLLLAPRIQKRIAARSFYALFLLLALRLAVPVEISLPKPAVTVPAPSYTVSMPVAPVQTPVQAPTVTGTPSVVQPVTPTAPAKREVPVTVILGAVWAAGTAVCVLWAVVSYRLARNKLLGSSAPASEEERALLDALRDELGVRRAVDLCRSGNTRSPLALGLFRPVVVLPEQPCPSDELALILRHELTHIRRWDVAYKMALSLACAVNWFNPFVWLMNRAAGRNLELCCDDEVVRGLSNQERQRYGKVLLDAAETARPLAFSTSFASGKRQLRDRLTNLFTEKKNSKGLVCVVLAAALLAGGLIACESASGAEGSDNDARRKLLEEYFYENYEEDTASVVLADLTGDGLDEMIVIIVTDYQQMTVIPHHNGVDPGAAEFGAAIATVCGVVDGQVTNIYSSRISIDMQGMGYTYLCPQEAGSYALLVRHDDTVHQQECHTYELVYFDETGNVVELDSMESSVMVGEFRDNIEAYQENATPLLAYGNGAFGYWNSWPAKVFSGEDTGEFFGSDGTPAEVSIEGLSARRKLLADYFYENYTENKASVVLADLTGDGLEEMLVITMDTDAAESYWRHSNETYHFALATIDCFFVERDQVISADTDFLVSSSHAGWGGFHLVPNPAGAGYAIMHFYPYFGMGQGFYGYDIYTLGKDGGLVTVAQEGADFNLDPTSLMGPDTSNDATREEVVELLNRVDAYRDSSVPLIVNTEEGGFSVAYLNTAPQDVFSGAIPMDIPSLWAYVMSEGEISKDYTLPQPLPANPEAALNRMEMTLQSYESGYVFRLPQYDGTWNVRIAGRMRTEGDDFMAVHYLEDEEWVSGRRYSFEVGDAYFSQLLLWVYATDPGGTTAERTFTLIENGYPEGVPASSPETALERLECNIKGGPTGFRFDIPMYDGEWSIEIVGQVRQEDGSFKTVRYLDNIDELTPGISCLFSTDDTGRAWFRELVMHAQVTDEEGNTAQRDIVLVENGTAPGYFDAGPHYPTNTPEQAAQDYLDAMSSQIFQDVPMDTASYTALSDTTGAASYTVAGKTVDAQAVRNRLNYLEYSGLYWQYRYHLSPGHPVSGFTTSYRVESVDNNGESAHVVIYQWNSFRYTDSVTDSGTGSTYKVDLVLCGSVWLVVDVTDTANDAITWWAYGKSEETYCDMTDLPHGMAWFDTYFNEHQNSILTDNVSSKFPIRCLAAVQTDDTHIELFYLCATGQVRQAQLIMQSEDSYTVEFSAPLDH